MQRGLQCLPDLAHLRITLLGGFHSPHSLRAPQLRQELLQWAGEGCGLCPAEPWGHDCLHPDFKGQGLSPGPRTPTLENHSEGRAAWNFGAPTRAGRTTGPSGPGRQSMEPKRIILKPLWNFPGWDLDFLLSSFSHLEWECLSCACLTVVFWKYITCLMSHIHSWRAVCFRKNHTLSLTYYLI